MPPSVQIVRRKCFESKMYPLAAETMNGNIDIANNNLFYPDDDFWDSGGSLKGISNKCSNMAAPGLDIWEKLDLQTPPRSPCLLSDDEPSDTYRLSEEEDCVGLYTSGNSNSIVANELIHDCMWSGQCADGCKTNSLTKCSMRTRVNSFGSISNLSDVSGYSLQNGSVMSVSLLGGVCMPFESDDFVFSSSSCGASSPIASCHEGPAALNDHSYSTVRGNLNQADRTCLTSDSSDSDDSSGSDDDDDESADDTGSDASVGGNQCYLGIPTPSDSEEEIDVVGLCDSASTINQSRLIRTVKTNLPTKPNASQQRTLQLAVERAAARNSPSILCPTKRRRIEDVSDNFAPKAKRKNVAVDMKPVSLLPKKVQTSAPVSNASGRKSGQKKNSGKRSSGSGSSSSSNRSDFEDDMNGSGSLKNRSQHNSMERKRRDDLRSSFFTLRDQVPELVSSQRASKVNILIKASDYIKKLKLQEASYERVKKQELKRKQELMRKLHSLQRNQ